CCSLAPHSTTTLYLASRVPVITLLCSSVAHLLATVEALGELALFGTLQSFILFHSLRFWAT
ncbi:hypothetical protein F5878DRAFT_729735, partial [Lentinula raphanica]